MVNVTLFELHLEGAQITANAPYNGETEESDETESVEVGEDDAGGFPLGLLAVLAIVALASAVAAKKVLGGSDEITDEFPE